MQSQKPPKQSEKIMDSILGACGFCCLFWGLLMIEQYIIHPTYVPGV